MVTKNDERKALEKIKKIVEELGDDSYISVAFEGCFDIAEENINNDFACSMEQKYNNEHEQVVRLLKEISDWNDDYLKQEAEIERLKKEIETKDQMLEQERSFKREVKKELASADREVETLRNIVEHLNEVVEAQDKKIMELKARLYDYICVQ